MALSKEGKGLRKRNKLGVIKSLFHGLGDVGFLTVCFIKLVIDFKLVESEDTVMPGRLVTPVQKSSLLLCSQWSRVTWRSLKQLPDPAYPVSGPEWPRHAHFR